MIRGISNVGRGEALLTHAEIAALLGCTRQNVYEAEQRALAKIRRAVLDDLELKQMAVEIGCLKVQ